MSICIIALEYLEKSYDQTKSSLNDQPYKVFSAIRDGVGNMSRAFAECFIKNREEILKYDYVWFITNITFEPEAPKMLADACERHSLAAIHPAFNSDHAHIQPNGSFEVLKVPFIEFTAPMFKVEVFDKFLLDTDHWYYYMDLIISKQLRDSKLFMGVHHGVHLGHVYLRNGQKEPITKLREKLRLLRDPIERNFLVEKYGPEWQKELFVYEVLL